MKFYNKFFALIVTGLLALCIGLLPNIIDMESILSLIVTWPKTVFFIIILLVAISLYLLRNIIENRTQKNEAPFKQWKHPILICDDLKSELATFSDELRGYDLDFVTLKDLSDYRLANSFEIIVSDICGLGAGRTTIPVLNTIKEKFPYKMIIAMSSVEGLHDDLRKDIRFVPKDREKKYVKDILKQIIEYSAELDDVDKHWSNTYESLMTSKADPEMIAKHKKRYYDYVSYLQTRT